MQKIKAVKLVETESAEPTTGLTIRITSDISNRLNKVSYDLRVTKRVLISTAIIKLLDEIEALGVELWR